MIWWRVPCGGYVILPEARDLKYLPPYAAQAARLFLEGRSGELLRGQGGAPGEEPPLAAGFHVRGRAAS